jgi:Tfp pilus assembly PilM family ATPase
MSEYLALDWDDQQLLGLDAQVTADAVHVRKWVRFDWNADARPSEHAEAAGKQLRLQLDHAGIAASHVLVSLPREEAIVRLLELPECTDDELPELVRLQAATRSAVPLDRLLLDFLPLPRMANVPGRRVLMVTLSKLAANRIQAVLTAARLEATGIHLSAVGAAEVIAHQSRALAGESDLSAALIVSRSASRVEITAISRNEILFMHGATVSAHLPPEAVIAQILAETSRASVALSQAAPGSRITSGWILGSTAELAGLSEAFRQRFGFDFQILETPFATALVRTDFDPKGPPVHAGFSPLGLLLARANPLVPAIDFLHPRQKIVKPDRRRLRQVLAGAGAVVTVVAILGGIHLRVTRLDEQIATLQRSNSERKKTLEKNDPLMKTSKSVEEWTQRNIDWLDQFRNIETAIGGTDRLHFVTFNGEVATLNSLATITASVRAKSRHDVEAMNEKLAEAGYGPRAKEIAPDEKNRNFPEKFELSVEINKLPSKEAATGTSTHKSTAKSSAKTPAGSESPATGAASKGSSK